MEKHLHIISQSVHANPVLRDHIFVLAKGITENAEKCTRVHVQAARGEREEGLDR